MKTPQYLNGPRASVLREHYSEVQLGAGVTGWNGVPQPRKQTHGTALKGTCSTDKIGSEFHHFLDTLADDNQYVTSYTLESNRVRRNLHHLINQ